MRSSLVVRSNKASREQLPFGITRNTGSEGTQVSGLQTPSDDSFTDDRRLRKQQGSARNCVGQRRGLVSMSKIRCVPYKWCTGLSAASPTESLCFRSQSTVCSSMKASNVRTLTTFPWVSPRTIWRSDGLTNPQKHNPKSGKAGSRCSLERNSRKTCPKLSPPHQRWKGTWEGDCVRAPPCGGLLRYVRRFQRRVAEPHADSAPSFVLSRTHSPQWKRANTHKVMRSTRLLYSPKQLNSHPVDQSDCLATPFAISASVCFGVMDDPVGRSLRPSSGNRLLVAKQGNFF